MTSIEKYETSDHWIITGRGEFCKFLEKGITYDEEGVKQIKFILRPSRELIEEYDLHEETDPKTGLLIHAYDENDVCTLRESTKKSLVLVKTDLLGEPTPISNEHTTLREKAKQYQIDRDIYKTALASKNQRMRQILIEEHAVAKDTADLVKEYRKAAGKTSKGREFEDEPEQTEEEMEP
ncbi:hypothetical protein GOV10_00940 [Candidatus Woesearchaeota archaeon]|nr:hypothetical protein [Candidatus Woesearchaeota archaeon]